METIHIISHTHWDREWYQTFQQFRLRLVHMLDNVLALLEKDQGFKHFMLDGQTIVLEDYLEMRPEKETELRDLVQSGRLVIGPWYILPDEFLVSPEAIIRNLIAGQRVCSRFGTRMNIGYIPDPFGHIGQMPQILHGFDIPFACLWRGLADEPCEFWWQSPDGTPVFMAYIRDSYSNGAALPANDPPRFLIEALRLAASLNPHSACNQRLIMFGTDHAEPPIETSQAITFANDNCPEVTFLHSTLPAFFNATVKELSSTSANIPVVQGELRSSKRSPLLPGVLSTRMWIKQRNHACETLLERWAEPFSTWASLLAVNPSIPQFQNSSRLLKPDSLLRQAWRILLACQPHDSICGCSIDQVHDEMRPRFDQVDQIATELTLQSLTFLADNVETSAPEDCFAAIAVFNPITGLRSEPVELEVKLPPGVESFEVIQKQQGDDHYTGLPFETAGLGSGEMIHMMMSPEEFQNASGMVQAGRVNGMAIRRMEYERQEDTIRVKIVLSDRGEPDLDAFASGVNQLKGLLKDRSIRHFEVVARSEDAVRLRFLAQDVPGPGLKTFWLRKIVPTQTNPIQLNVLTRLALPLIGKVGKVPLAARWLNNPKSARPPYVIENEVYRLEARREDGTLELLDKRTGTRYSGLNRFVDGGDCGDTYNYCPPAVDEFFRSSRIDTVTIATGKISQQMDIFQRVRIPASISPDRKTRSKALVDLQLQTTITLWNGGERVDFHTRITNLASDHRLRVHFPMPFSTTQAAYDGHFEVVDRSVGIPEWDASWVEQPRPEQPQRMFTGVTDGTTGFILSVRGLPEVEVLQNSDGKTELALTLLRCVGWLSRDDLITRPGHAGPYMATPGAQMPGEHEFDYAIISYAGAGVMNPQTAAHQLARQFNAPMRAEASGIHPGVLPPQCQLIHVDPASFEVTTIKQSEDGLGWIVRGYNPTPDPVEVTIQPWRRFSNVELARLDEASLGKIDCDSDGSSRIIVNSNSIVTLRYSD